MWNGEFFRSGSRMAPDFSPMLTHQDRAQHSGVQRDQASGWSLSSADRRANFATMPSHIPSPPMAPQSLLAQTKADSATAKSGSWGRMGNKRENFMIPMRIVRLAV